MRLVFAGTPEFAARALEALVAAGHEIALVLCQPDRPAGRGLQLAECAVKKVALALGLQVFQPASLRDTAAQATIRARAADAMVVAAYGLLLPAAVLQSTRIGAINIHASLLPRWRGAAPIQRALMAGDLQTGVTIMQMNEGLDTGPMRSQRAIDISPDEDAGTLHDRLATLGASMVVEALERPDGPTVPQPAEGVTYAHKILRKDTLLDWSQSAPDLERIVRALRPTPGAQAQVAGETLKVWRAQTFDGAGVPGERIESGSERLVIACGSGALSLQEVQRPGGKRLDAGAFARGARLARTQV